MTTQEKQLQAWIEEAKEEGRNAGIAAASWCLDGNTPQEHIRRMVSMFDEGDPQPFDYLPAPPDLSGEWAGRPTPYSLYQDIVGLDLEPDHVNDAAVPVVEALSDAWEEGRDEVFEPECERLFRQALNLEEE